MASNRGSYKEDERFEGAHVANAAMPNGGYEEKGRTIMLPIKKQSIYTWNNIHSHFKNVTLYKILLPLLAILMQKTVQS